ncbi:MAG: hypothetical protein HYR84_11335, partial [Planctomycetes bacterium]|nr:hypothetical protein [Planctomycetota bacterium]
AAVKTALDQYGAAGFQIDGDTLQLCFRAAKAWPTQISDKEQVLWTLQRKTAAYRKEKLDQLLLGKQIVHCEVIAKKGDKRDGDVQFPECTYLDGKDVHDYFLEPYPKNTSLYRSGPFPKFTKVLHGLRTVRSEKGEVELIENWYAGALHGQQITFRDGRRSSITTYEYGVLHGMYRRYSGGEIWNEENYVDGRRVSARYFHSNGQPSDFWLENVLREERDEKGNLIPTRKIEMQKPHGAWEIVAATQDGKPRAGEKGGELTFVEDDVRVKLPGKKGTMTMNAHLRRPGTLPYLDFHPMVLERRFRCPLDELRYGRYAVDGITLTISFGTVFPRTSATRGRCFGFSRRKQSSPGVLDARTDVVRRKIGLAALDASACAGAASKWTALAVGGKAAQWQRDVANRLVCDKS